MKEKLYIPLTLILLSLCLTACYGKGAKSEQNNSAQAKSSEDKTTNNDSSESILLYPVYDEAKSASIDTMYLIDENDEKKAIYPKKSPKYLNKTAYSLTIYQCGTIISQME